MSPKLKSIIINLVLFAVVVFLAIMVIKSIQAPINFNNEKELREKPESSAMMVTASVVLASRWAA